LIISFLLGIVAIFPALLIENSLSHLGSAVFFQTIQGVGIKAFFLVALVEELCKFVMLRFYAYKRPEFDEPFDGIVYAVMVGMGFATLENIFYVSQYGVTTGIIRMFMAIPAHATFAIILGYFMGKARFSLDKEKHLMRAGIFWAVVFHGSYDFFLMLQENQLVLQYTSGMLLFLGALVSLITGIILSNKAIKEHLNLSMQNNQNNTPYDDY
jgi:RsiW-degrading membrane proteinase PrsW (M82 family)